MPTLFRSAALLVVFALLPDTAAAQEISGPASVVDGDTFLIGRDKIRLFGIDAPELNQTCRKDGTPWRCGEAAKKNLSDLVEGKHVICLGREVDQFSRRLAVCSADGVELNETMVAYGWAVAFREYSDAYVPAELRAKANRIGIWDSEFEMPANYRLAQLPAPTVAAAVRPQAARPKSAPSPTGCVIKGNRNRRGEWIYHLPGMPHYDQTRPEEIFCSEAEARAAGYRRSRARN